MPANVVVIIKEMIKPSSPTPHHLKQLKLSFLDQMAPIIYVPLIFFYEPNQKYSTQLLKTSLSKALTHYYPLAGRTTASNCYINCNDAGALFIEAKVVGDVDFKQFIEKPNYIDDMNQLLYLHPIGCNLGDEVILAVQINLFGCGGIAIAVQMCHKIADGNSLVNFMYAWAAICRGDVELVMNPSFDAASFFPPIDLSADVKPTMSFSKENIVTKHLVFDKTKLEILKAEAASANNGIIISHCPTRVEVVSAIIWKQLMEVTKHKIGINTKFVLLQAVNLRPRMNPSLPDCAFGNIISHTVAIHTKNEGLNEYQSLVCNLRVAIKAIDEYFVKKVQKRDEYMDEFDSFVESISKREIEPCFISSWCRFPVYEVDYGWGKPVWVSSATVPYKNSALFLTTKNGDGIEVWFHMLEEDASVFQSNLTSWCP